MTYKLYCQCGAILDILAHASIHLFTCDYLFTTSDQLNSQLPIPQSFNRKLGLVHVNSRAASVFWCPLGVWVGLNSFLVILCGTRPGPRQLRRLPRTADNNNNIVYHNTFHVHARLAERYNYWAIFQATSTSTLSYNFQGPHLNDVLLWVLPATDFWRSNGAPLNVPSHRLSY